MDTRSLHDGREDGLEPLESLSLDGIASFRDLLRAMSKTAFSGRQLGEAFDVLLAMARDPSCRVVLTISGAMTVAKQGRIICDLIERGLVRAKDGETSGPGEAFRCLGTHDHFEPPFQA